jgi:fatty-acyl-CoA synthase
MACRCDKDLVKSGGEWISSVALESALMGHPAVAEAAVIPVASLKWSDKLRAFLSPLFPKSWLQAAFEFINEIPRTAGKFQKSALRLHFRDYQVA